MIGGQMKGDLVLSVFQFGVSPIIPSCYLDSESFKSTKNDVGV